MLSFWASKDDTASSSPSTSSAVHHLQGAPALKGVCYVSVTVHYKHDESSTAELFRTSCADGEGREVAMCGGGRHSSSIGVRAGAEF
jgi:hypothetical protein